MEETTIKMVFMLNATPTEAIYSVLWNPFQTYVAMTEFLVSSQKNADAIRKNSINLQNKHIK